MRIFGHSSKIPQIPSPPPPRGIAGVWGKLCVIKKGQALEDEVKKGGRHWTMKGIKWLIRAEQGRNKLIKRLGQPQKSDIPGSAWRGMGVEQFDWRINGKCEKPRLLHSNKKHNAYQNGPKIHKRFQWKFSYTCESIIAAYGSMNEPTRDTGGCTILRYLLYDNIWGSETVI